MQSQNALSLGDYAKPKTLGPGYAETTPDLAYVVGVMMGDGFYPTTHVKGRTGGIALNTVDRDFAEAFALAVRRQFGREPKINVYVKHAKGQSKTPYYNAALHSRPTADLVQKIETPEWVRALPLEMKVAWLRGAWDSEGCIGYRMRGNHMETRVEFAATEEPFVRLYADILTETTGIIPSVRLQRLNHVGWNDVYQVNFWRGVQAIKFFDIVQPSIQRKRARFEEIKRYYQR